MENTVESLTIGAFAKAAGVNVETIRFYQRKGLLPEPDKPYGSIRRYGEADVVRVKFVKSAQRLGFSLAEIREYMHLHACRPQPERTARDAAGKVNQRLKALEHQKSDLAALVTELEDIRLQTLDTLNRTHDQTRAGAD